ncbi:MAG: Gfo/Idh/MocA family oxidoreductase [Anaerolineales bacterium]|nr:Gfo/Idh/MocA family oxidoreductase [Anaerolineales bacterium]
MKILIAGYGSIGRRHFRNLLNLGVKDILFYSTHNSTIEKDEISGFIIEDDLEDALAHKPDAVIVSNPTSLHLDVAIPAAKAGCHLLIEKPLSHNLDRIEKLRKFVDQSGSKVLMGFQFRYHPGLHQIKELLAERKIGKPLSVRVHWGEYLPYWHPWENHLKGYSARADLGGGVILTLCHPLDYLLWLLGEINSVQAFLGYSGELGLIAVEDTAEINLRFESGVIGSVHLNYNQRPPVHDLGIIGTEGTIYWNGLDGSVKIFRAETGKWNEYFLKENFERNDLFIEEMQHFLDIISTGKTPICSLDDGIVIQEIIHYIKQSEKEGKVIKV